MLKTINFIKSHKHWKDLLQAAPYHLHITEDANFVMLRYNQLESDFSQQICRECRGLVIDKHTLDPVALSFTKFFNYGEEHAAKIDWKSARVQEKVDGSKIMLFWNQYENKWQVCTSGTLNAFEATVGAPSSGRTFGSLFESAFGNSWAHFLQMLNQNKIYTFELVSPYTRIVVPYPETKAYLIGQRDRETFQEETPYIFGMINYPQQYPHHSLEECIAATAQMDYTEEGFVVVDKFYNRIKIKSQKYLEAHYSVNNHVITPKRVMDIIIQGEESEFLAYFPEYRSDFAQIKESMEQWKANGITAIKDTMSHQFTSRKELVAYIMQNHNNNSDLILRFLDNIESYVDLYLRRMTSNQRIQALKLNNEKE